MKRIAAVAFIVSCLYLSALGQVDTKPNFSGTWKSRNSKAEEVWVIEHKETEIHIIMKVEDNLGKRVMDMKANIDGKEYNHVVNNTPATLMIKWEGDALVCSLKREMPNMVINNQRTMTLSKDGKTIIVDRVLLSPGPERRAVEIWDRQTDTTSTTPPSQSKP
jgi:hypothetical protein